MKGSVVMEIITGRIYYITNFKYCKFIGANYVFFFSISRLRAESAASPCSSPFPPLLPALPPSPAAPVFSVIDTSSPG